MQLPLSLIRSFIELSLSPVKIGETLTLLGIEVDQIHNAEPPCAGVVVGEVLSVKRHPEADKLHVAQVSDGSRTHSVVCGAPNCRAGMKTAFAKIDAILPGARRIEKTSIRGVESHGMLCSAAELHLWDDATGILDLPQEMKPGADLMSLLWDPVFELSLTPNLGHCMSALGIARELSAAFQIPIRRPKTTAPESPLNKEVIVRDFHLCPRYTCRLIEGVQVEASPFWLKRTLEACGQKSINSIVDFANYTMLKVGQPLHAFDWDLLEGNTLEIAPAQKEQTFLGLDGIERTVPVGTLLINDSRKAVAIAGLIGGANSAVSPQTKRVLLEAASFDPIAIRTASKKLALRTESSHRFERGVDPLGVLEALNEAALGMGGALKGCVDLKKSTFAPKTISFRPSRANQLLGTQLSATEMEEIFQRLGFTPKTTHIGVPLYRADINEEIDLIEEVARIYGYNNIEKTIPHCTTSQMTHDATFLFERQLRHQFVALGLIECITCDLISPKLAEVARQITPSLTHFLQATYSKSEEYSILRTSLLPGLLQVTKTNLDQKNLTLSLFEMGRIHFLQNQRPTEIPMGAVLLTGKRDVPHWSQKMSDIDFFDLKGMIERLVHGTFKPSNHLSFHPGRQADIHVDDLIVGSFGEVHPLLLEQFHIDQRVFYAELHLPHLMKLRKTHVRMEPLPQFPASERDWTIPLDPKVPIATLFQAISSLSSPLLEKAELIDLYAPQEAPQKNATFRFTYRDLLKTISSEEADKEHSRILAAITQFLQR